MFEDASIDVGCGTFKWAVDGPPKEDDEGGNEGGDEPPPPPPPAPEKPKLGERKCHDEHDHKDVKKGNQKTHAEMACKYHKDMTMKPGDEPLMYSPPGMMGNDWPQIYKISWIEGCDMVEEQDAKLPLEDDHESSCSRLLIDNYALCKFPEPRSVFSGNFP